MTTGGTLSRLQEQIKSYLTNLMLRTPHRVRTQLSEALVIISTRDFPSRWPTLLPELVEKLASPDPNTINGVLETANSILKRYRNQYRTNSLVHELEQTQNAFAPPLLATFLKLRPQVDSLQSNPEALRVVLSSVRLCCRIFYSLNSPGLTEVGCGPASCASLCCEMHSRALPEPGPLRNSQHEYRFGFPGQRPRASTPPLAACC